MFEALEKISIRPRPFEFYTAVELWTNDHTSEQMLSYHLNESGDLSSRNGAFIDRSVAWITSHFNIGTNIRIADFGCGPGLYTTRLARNNADVTGIDFSGRSVQYAKKIASSEDLSIRYLNQNYLDLDLDLKPDDRFQLILMIMCDYCALSPDQRKRVLSKFYTLLEPAGSVLLDVYSMVAYGLRQEAASYGNNLLNGFWSPNSYFGFLNSFKYEEEKVTLDKYTIVEASCTRTVYNWLQYFTPETLEKEFADCGFAVEEFYSDVAGSPYDAKTKEFAIVARKQ